VGKETFSIGKQRWFFYHRRCAESHSLSAIAGLNSELAGYSSREQELQKRDLEEPQWMRELARIGFNAMNNESARF
jgi:hypothetical protein